MRHFSFKILIKGQSHECFFNDIIYSLVGSRSRQYVLFRNRWSTHDKRVCSLLRKEAWTTQIIIIICISINMIFKYILHFISLHFLIVYYFYTEIHLKVSMTSSLLTYICLPRFSKASFSSCLYASSKQSSCVRLWYTLTISPLQLGTNPQTSF